MFYVSSELNVELERERKNYFHFTFYIHRCLLCDLVDILFQPNGRKLGSFTNRFHELFVASSIAVKVLVGVVPALLALVLLDEDLLVDLQGILGQLPRLGLNSVTGGQEHVVVNISARLDLFPWYQDLDSGLLIGAVEVKVHSFNWLAPGLI